jgi:hypothetical protein
MSLMSVVCCHMGVLSQANHSSRVGLQECGASECNREATVIRGPWPTRGCYAIGGGVV